MVRILNKIKGQKDELAIHASVTGLGSSRTCSQLQCRILNYKLCLQPGGGGGVHFRHEAILSELSDCGEVTEHAVFWLLFFFSISLVTTLRLKKAQSSTCTLSQKKALKDHCLPSGS